MEHRPSGSEHKSLLGTRERRLFLWAVRKASLVVAQGTLAAVDALTEATTVMLDTLLDFTRFFLLKK